MGQERERDSSASVLGNHEDVVSIDAARRQLEVGIQVFDVGDLLSLPSPSDDAAVEPPDEAELLARKPGAKLGLVHRRRWRELSDLPLT